MLLQECSSLSSVLLNMSSARSDSYILAELQQSLRSLIHMICLTNLLLAGLITFWKWYNPTQPHPSPTSPPAQTIQFTPPEPPSEPQTPEEELQEQLESEREQKLCLICTVNTKCAVLLPCRHCCLCVECSEKLMSVEQPQCPLCRQGIANVMQIYL